MLVAVFFGVAVSPAFGQATRTWVSGVGDDANPCSRTAPCKTFAGAISKTFIAGEINAMDDGGFGTVTITKSITIDGGGHHASVLSSGIDGVNINIAANPNDPNRRVVLRGLSINGAGAFGTIGTSTGVHGIDVTANGAATIHLENTRIANFTRNGIGFSLLAGAPSEIDMSLDNVIVTEVGGNALDVRSPDATRKLNVLVRDSRLEGSRGTFGVAGETGIGVSADTGAHVWLTGSTIFNNLIGLKTFSRLGAPGVIDSFCDNQIAGNVDDGTKPNELCPQPAPQPAPQPTVVTETVPAPESCVVPNLRGLTVAFARRILQAARCALGRVTKKRTTKRKQLGKVIAQKTKAGTQLAKGAKVGVTVGRR